MTVRRGFALAVAILAVGARPSAGEPRARPLAVTGVAALYLNIPLAGVDVGYDVNSRLALDAQLMSVILLHDLTAGARFLFARFPYGGFYLGASAHYLTSFTSDGAFSVSAEAGIEKRSESGGVFSLGVGYMRRAPFECDCVLPSEAPVPLGGPGLLIRVGKAF